MRVVLDTSVLIAYFRGKPELRGLFASDLRRRIHYAVNPVVLQELLFVGGAAGESVDLGFLKDKLEVIPSDLLSDPLALSRLRSLRNSVVHANDLVILGSTHKGDVLLTYDEQLLALREWSGVRI